MRLTKKQKETIINELTSHMAWFGIDMQKFELEKFKASKGVGYISWRHKDDDQSLKYSERRLECSEFQYNEDRFLTAWKFPSFG